ncbi:MAG: NUDIX domain-containing protein [Candidatus Saccharimonadales bacterium]
MGKAVRAIIIEDGQLLVMRRTKYGSEYFTLVGGQVKKDESLEEALAREVREETGLEITSMRPVFYEPHPEPYNEQFVYLCEVAPHGEIAVQQSSEEGFMNKLEMNIHAPAWVSTRRVETLDFRTPQLQTALVQALKKGFPQTVVKL